MKSESKKYARTLTIAGSDSGGGAGIQADLKTFSALGCYGMSVITALTAQNTTGVRSIFEVSSDFIGDQIDAVLSDIGADAVKIGMLHRSEIIRVVAERLKHYGMKSVVLDPVMVAKSGDHLLKDEATDTLKDVLFPITKILTPNLPEASVLLARKISGSDEMEKAAMDLTDLGPSIVVIKGGHSDSSQSDDYVCIRDARGNTQGTWLKTTRIKTQNTHGTGCTFSSAIASFLAHGFDSLTAIRKAKDYLFDAIKAGADYKLGSGHGPVHHFHRLWNQGTTSA